MPAKNEHVAMRAEDITMEVVKSTATGEISAPLEWKVDAIYTFENTSKEEVTVQVGFPEFSCGGDSPCPEAHPYSFHDLKTSVRGKSITHTIGKISRHAKGWSDDLARVHLFTITFKPEETLTITHTYRFALSQSVEGMMAHYVTRTGALWAGPIGTARFTIKTPWPHSYVAYPEEYTLIARHERPTSTSLIAGKSSTWTHVFEMKDWTPREDLYILFGNHMERGPQRCEAVTNVDWLYDELMEKWEDATPDKKARVARVEDELITEYFAGLTDVELRQCRNWPYALHGYSFKDDALHAFFYAKPFSTHCAFCGTTPEDTFIDEDNPTRFTRFFHMPNPSYTPKLLTASDLRYVRLAKTEQARRREASHAGKK